MEESVFAAHSAILQAGENEPDLKDMGTTVVLALWRGDHFLICHVGDSRAYIVSDDSISPLTQDHTFVAE